MSYGNDFEILEDLWNNLSCKTYDGGYWVALVRHMVGVVGCCERNEIFDDYMTYALLHARFKGTHCICVLH